MQQKSGAPPNGDALLSTNTAAEAGKGQFGGGLLRRSFVGAFKGQVRVDERAY